MSFCDLSKKTALITGGSRGIGYGIACELSRAGAEVFLVSRNEERLTEAVQRIQESGGTAHAFPLDVSHPDAGQDAVKFVIETAGRLDILVNNAGIARDNLLLRMKDEEWDAVIQTNLRSAFFFTKAAMRPMMKARWGRIINISSVIGLIGNPGQANYAASKAGLIGLTKSAAREVASRGITVNAVAPGFIETDMTAALSAEQVNEIKSRIPQARLGNVADVAAAVRYLSSEESAYLTGQVITVDGGMVMGG
ncbi:MAG: 3-oxoacyl-[acyl-carrier-protein] reductase [Candidatus Hydrogenedentota bacterium]|nr:MAG: 3-oxoacyl-[acyl-carrier-protein] reductase [Candidatus Hydrogenedentota bacterium]